MAYFASSSQFVYGVWVTGFATLVMSLLLTLEVLRMRARSAKRARRRARFIEEWRPLLFDVALGGAPEIPALDRRDADTFLALWNEVQDALHVDARSALNAVAERVGATERARSLLENGDGALCVGALRMLSHLRRREDYALVARFLDDPRQHVSVAAARAATQIDPVRAARDVVPRIATRSDWPVSLLVNALAGVDRKALATQLRTVSLARDPGKLVRLLPLVALTDDRDCEEILRASASDDAEVTAAVLKCVRTPALVDLARRACQHKDWTVRTQAAAALGRVGGAQDQALVARLLTDPQWWVRYRAAQALVRSTRLATPERIAALRDELQDRYARDILAHVAAEARS